MKRLALLLIAIATPPSEREWLIGDTVEEFARVERHRGRIAAHWWLGRELFRVLVAAPRHWLAQRTRPHRIPARHGDGMLAALAFDIRSPSAC
jgi:hypothetical protein